MQFQHRSSDSLESGNSQSTPIAIAGRSSSSNSNSDSPISHKSPHCNTDSDFEDNNSKSSERDEREGKWRKDGRLFPDMILYCEGYNKPLLRGMLHLFCSIFLPFALLHLNREANGSFYGILSGTLYVLSNIWCYGCSALYHVGRWSVSNEILLQKLDHCGIAALSVGTMLPTCFLLLPPFEGFLLGFSSFSLFIWTSFKIFRLEPAIYRQVLVPATILPFLYQLYWLMNRLEFLCTMSTILFQLIGLTIFTREKPNLFPGVFGHHELFHVFVCLAGASVYIGNWSIISRKCGGHDSIFH